MAFQFKSGMPVNQTKQNTRICDVFVKKKCDATRAMRSVRMFLFFLVGAHVRTSCSLYVMAVKAEMLIN